MRTRIITIITLLLSTPMIIAQKSMDEIDRESFAAKLSPIEVKGIQMTEAGNIPLVRDTPAKISLDGTWQQRILCIARPSAYRTRRNFTYPFFTDSGHH